MATTDTIFYTDGHEVIVTNTTFKVHRKEFKLPGITRHGFTQLKPHRAPGVFTLCLGLLVLSIGLLEFEFLPAVDAFNVRVFNQVVGFEVVSMAVGSLAAFAGLLMIIAAKPKYAVWISTAEGDLNAVVSRHLDYIHLIIDGLNRAFMSSGRKA